MRGALARGPIIRYSTTLYGGGLFYKRQHPRTLCCVLIQCETQIDDRRYRQPAPWEIKVRVLCVPIDDSADVVVLWPVPGFFLFSP